LTRNSPSLHLPSHSYMGTEEPPRLISPVGEGPFSLKRFILRVDSPPRRTSLTTPPLHGWTTGMFLYSPFFASRHCYRCRPKPAWVSFTFFFWKHTPPWPWPSFSPPYLLVLEKCPGRFRLLTFLFFQLIRRRPSFFSSSSHEVPLPFLSIPLYEQVCWLSPPFYGEDLWSNVLLFPSGSVFPSFLET